MKIFLNILLIMASAVLLVCFCFCVPSPLYGGTAETLFDFSGFRLTVFGVGAGLAMLITLILAGIRLKNEGRPLADTLCLAILGLPLVWLGGKAAYLLSVFRQVPVKDVLLPQNGGFHLWGAAAGLALAGAIVSPLRKSGIGKTMNAIGLGLLPGIAVACMFRLASAEPGRFVWVVPFTGGAFTVNLFLAESALFLAAFAAMMIWLIFRGTPLPGNGDLLLVALSLCGTVRLLILMNSAVAGGNPVMWSWSPLALAFALMLLPLLVWSVRFGRGNTGKAYIPLCWSVFIAAGVSIVMRIAGKWSLPLDAVDSAVSIALILLVLKSVCCMGRVSRKLVTETVPAASGIQPSAES